MVSKIILKSVVAAAIGFSCINPAFASYEKPGEGVTLKPARATWTTGFFQEAIIRQGLEELGYKVKKAKDLAVPIFYKSVSLGDVDYWTNGWFPIHNAQLPKDFEEKVEKVGYVVKAGGLQGYLVSKDYADKLNIKSLADFKRPEVVKVFDKNGDGKADLVGCPTGWGCNKVVDFHLETYDLKDTVKASTASYEAAMAGAYAEFKTGEPVFFYSWAPNWTIFKMKPGKDVYWMNVPEIVPTKDQAPAVDRMTVADVKGAVTNPVKLGFVVSDVRIVGNKKFLAENPAAKRLFELFKLELSAINEQNLKMGEGEKTNKDVKRHAAEWIAKNQVQWDAWLEEARQAAK